MTMASIKISNTSINNFLNEHSLQLNVKKTKKLFDFHKTQQNQKNINPTITVDNILIIREQF